MLTEKEIIANIRDWHRQRRFAMKIQQKLDRALESFVRVNATKWTPDLDEKERAKINLEVKAIIKSIRDAMLVETCKTCHQQIVTPTMIDQRYTLLIQPVVVSDRARAPADDMRNAAEKEMERLAKLLKVYPWIENIRGAGALGLATIVAEAPMIGEYGNPGKLVKRLGFAPFEGLAGSSWKREKWRPRALTKEEWIANPFNGERYALMHQIAVWLVNTQTKSKTKTESGETEPTGPYGEEYCNRRKETLETHPDWTDGHRRMDALRIAMKEFLIMLWAEWTGKSKNKRGSGRPSKIRHAKAFIKRHEERRDAAG
jgi:hypothetical protein